MKIQNYRDVEGREALPGVVMRIVAGTAEGAPNFVMRLFEVAPGCASPAHTHPWEHEIFILSGTGVARGEGIEKPVGEGDAIMILPGERHCILNTGDSLLRFICVVPVIDGRMAGAPPD